MKKTVLIIIFALLASCASQIFYPSSPRWQQTPHIDNAVFSNHFLQMPDGVWLNLWQITPKQASQGTILYFHGNSQNISHHIQQIAWLVENNYQVTMAEYRGFGVSEGELSLKKTTHDMQYIMHWFIKENPQQARWLLGQSLGAALSIHVAGHDATLAQAFTGMVFDSAFASFQSIGKDVLARYWFTWVLQYPLSLAMPKGVDAISEIHHLSPTPILLLHSRQDFVVPYYHVEKLYKKAGEPKTLISYTGGHIEGFKQPLVKEQTLAFLRSSAYSLRAQNMMLNKHTNNAAKSAPQPSKYHSQPNT